MRQHRAAMTLALVMALPGCSTVAHQAPPAAREVTAPAAAVVPAPPGGRAGPVAPLREPAHADVLVVAPTALAPEALRRLQALSQPGGSVVLRAGRVRLEGRLVQAVGVDPSTFRRFAARGTADSDALWQAVARGEAVASHSLAGSLHLTLGRQVVPEPLHGGTGSPLRLAALATTGVPGSDLVTDEPTADRLGLPASSAVLLVAARGQDPVDLASRARAVTGPSATVDLLTSPLANPTAFLTGSSAAGAFGAFSYRYSPTGGLEPDPAWVAAHIVSERVPILGLVTCHRLMFPQLRGALTEVVAAGLGGTLHSYNGCYVPKLIEGTTAISLHTWGIAIDMDTATNQRGTKGTMDPRTVAIFKRWGFRWGGDWHWTDPMHFELCALLNRPA